MLMVDAFLILSMCQFIVYLGAIKTKYFKEDIVLIFNIKNESYEF